MIVTLEEISPELIINFDQTGLKYIPVTAVFAGAMSGTFLPPQLIYKCKTKAYLPKVDFQKVGTLHLCTIIGPMRIQC